MFIFFGDIEPKELMKGARWAVNVGHFYAIINDDGIACQTEMDYKESFDEEIRRPAMLVMDCVAVSQAIQTSRIIKIRAKRWIELKISPESLRERLIVGSILHPSELPVDNKTFLDEFGVGLKYANQAFVETTFRLALEDYTRSLDSIWDEAIYHCQHCLECIRDYFGTWEKMRAELNIKESELRSVTDFSAEYIRHGAKRAQLQSLPEQQKVGKAQDAQGICRNTLAVFGTYLDSQGINFSSTWRT